MYRMEWAREKQHYTCMKKAVANIYIFFFFFVNSPCRTCSFVSWKKSRIRDNTNGKRKGKIYVTVPISGFQQSILVFHCMV